MNGEVTYVLLVLATLSLVICGMHYGWSAPSLPKLLDESSPIHIDENMGYWLVTTPIFSTVIGDLTTPVLVDNIGRHKTILLSAIPYFIGWIIIYFSTTIPLMLTARFLSGISFGWSFCAVPMYTSEIAEPRIRGLLGSLLSVSWIFGMLLIDVIGSYCSLKITALISSALPIVMVATFFFMPESPYYLIAKGKEDGAKRKLQILRGTEDVDKEMSRIKKGIEEDSASRSNPLDLFRIPSNRKGIIILLVLKACQECSGDSAITFYSQIIFKEAGSDISEQLASIIYFSIAVLITLVAAGLVDKAGRRPLLIFSAIGSAVSLLVEGAYFYLKSNTGIDLSSFTVVPLIALISFMVCFSSGLKIVPLLMFSELLPPSVKATALCLTDMCGVVVVTALAKFFQVTRDNFGMHFPFISFGVVCVFSLIFIIFCVPETKCKTLEEIQDYFKGKLKDEEESGDGVQIKS